LADDLERDALEWMDGDMPFSTRFGDHFYTREDGRAETGHVFIGQNRLAERWGDSADMVIAELGFGTGLNFLETWRQWQFHRLPGARLDFVSFEALPMTADEITTAIGRWPDLAPLCVRLVERWPDLTSTPVTWILDPQTRLTVVAGDALDGVTRWNGLADAWYLDGFAPARNPDMWSEPLMQAVFDRTKPGGTFATYTAAGWVRRNLQAAGFDVEKVPGFGGKREMMRGRRPD
jgi:tRNA U34 5-methylaminomethyl-2-thiouridine-forming methyltransferase MnmC